MNGILEYINQFGDKSFEEKPFGNVDGLILSQFSYLKLDGMVPGVDCEAEPILIKDILKCANYEDLYQDERYAKNNRALFEAMADSVRYGEIGLNYYINLVSHRWELQFSAIVCFLPRFMPVVVYRGTDESIVGWKEDFNMAFMTPIPAQVKSAHYLNYVAERIKGDFSICGHSKGGNLAVYAAMKCPDVTRNRIVSILSFDGPGFTKQALEDGDYDKVRSKIRKFVPKSSIVGMLLQNQEDYSVVLSKKFGILQHDPFNWIVVGDDFEYVNDIDGVAAIHDKSINEWTENTSNEDMREFVNQMFKVIEDTGINDLNDIKGNYAEILIKFTNSIEELDDKQKNLMKTLFKSLFETVIETVRSQSNISAISELDKRNRKNI